MDIICVDQDAYVGVLEAKIKPSGGRVIRAAPDCIAALRPSKRRVIVMDVGNAPPPRPGRSGRPSEIYEVLRKASIRRLTGTRKIIVFTRISKAEFGRLASTAGVRLRQVAYYSKQELEIPSVLACIAQEIFERPDLVGLWDVRGHVPQAVTRRWVAQQPSVSVYLFQYLLNLIRGKEWRSQIRILKKLPRGYRALYQLWLLWGKANNGGFQAYLDAAIQDDPTGRLIADTADTLVKFGMEVVAGLLAKAVAVAMPELPLRARRHLRAIRIAVPGSESSLRASQGLPRASDFDALDERFFSLDAALFPKLVDKYVKANPTEFIHAGSRARRGKTRVAKS